MASLSIGLKRHWNAAEMRPLPGAGQARATSSAVGEANSDGTEAALSALPAGQPEPRLAFAIVVVMSITGATANLVVSASI
jgi:hypothetical protein